MKKNQFVLLKRMRNRKWAAAFCFCTLLLGASSCTEGYEAGTYSSGVSGVTLESPKATDIVITPSADGTTATITWPVVYGAGGYQFSLYIVDDPANPVAVGEANQVVDGCSAKRNLLEDTKYKVEIKTLGNEKYNNKGAEVASEASYSTLLPTTAVIPNGTDLGTYFTTNPIPASDVELAYELVAGGNYTMSKDINIGLTNVTIRGDKVNRPKITMSTGSFLSEQGAYKVKFIDFDCANFTATSVFSFTSTQNAAALDNGWVTISSPIVIQSCNVKGLAKYLYHDNNKKYASQTFLIKDCVVEQNTTAQMRLIYWQGGFMKDCIITNSTFSNKNAADNGYFIQGNSNRATANTKWGWLSAGLNVQNCTFWQIVKVGQMGNYAGWALKDVGYFTFKKNIFVDCGNGYVMRYFSGNSGNGTKTWLDNSYWFNGDFPANETAHAYGDKSGTEIKTDPKLKDPANGDFTVQGTEQLAARCGDPRWLPGQ